MTVSVRKQATAEDVYKSVVAKIGLSSTAADYFYLFEIVEYNFGEFKGRKIDYLKMIVSF